MIKFILYETDKDININFNKISDFLYAPSLTTELLSTKRYQKCYARSLNLANLIGDCNILTGYANFNNLKYLQGNKKKKRKIPLLILSSYFSRYFL